MIDVAALGECLIDFTPNGENAQGIALFARNPGGAPANVLAMNARPSQLMVSLGVSAKMSVEALQEFDWGKVRTDTADRSISQDDFDAYFDL